MKKLSTSILLCLVFWSCSKIDTKNAGNLVTPDLEITPKIINGTLLFKTADEVVSTISFLANLSDTERKGWEEKNGFYSIKRRVIEGYDAIHKANQKESLVDLEKALQDYKDVIAENDTSYYEIYPSTPYQFICNRNGLYLSSNHVLKVNPEEIEVYNFEDLSKLNSGIQIEPISRYSNYHHTLKTDVKSSSTSMLSGEYYDNPSGCKNDRRCYVVLKDVVIYGDWICTDPQGYEYSLMAGTVELFFSAYGTERNWLCNWSRYSTLLAYRNVSYSIYGFQNSYAQQYPNICNIPYTTSTIVPFSVTIPDYAPPNDSFEIGDFKFIGHCIINENSIYNELANNYLGFISAHAESTSRGIGYYVNWAIINQ